MEETRKPGRPRKVNVETGEVEPERDVKINKLLEAYEAQKKELEEAKAKLADKELVEKKEKDPMSGPGTLCECTKITLSTAWQLKSREVINPITKTEEMKPEPTPEGYVSRMGPNNGLFIVEPGKETNMTPLQEAALPDCRSKYTREVVVYGPKAIGDKGNFKKEPPKVKVHLCEKHIAMFGARDK